MQAAGGIANFVFQPRFNIHMDVFQASQKGELTGRNFCRNFLQALVNCLTISCADDVLSDQHGSMCAGAGNVLGEKTLVKIDRRINGVHDLIGSTFKATAPYLTCRG